ncbi:D-apionate oxidoisomerase [Baekduia alba]|uniref:phosphogluconate dehydrogenase C-terminal domain-containing protein n=1 Tax=Baekduia alba TaxID=2997333 RepID=UPI00233F915E|nr:phosphogluconate dehydrogenase C-terminal domain-containing protein [Baekduia alba]WCB95327.1 D-apionate oxidoisomerase [Baekduia alba]
MIDVTLVGAAGRMGGRVRRSLRDDATYRLTLVENDPAGVARLAAEGWATTPPDAAYRGAELVVFAVPDRIVGDVAADVVPRLDPGALVVCLDPAGAHADKIPRRDDVGCFVTHPTHPPLFDLLAEPTIEARRDYWGGGLARQSLVHALVWGPESDYARGVALAERVFRPVLRSFRVSLADMALLEPAMSETITLTCIQLIRDALDEVVARGVDPLAARDFLLGHVQISCALLFGELDWELSDGAKQAVRDAMEDLIQPGWREAFAPDAVRLSVGRITGEQG